MKKTIKILLFTLISALFFLTLTTSAEDQYEFTAQKVANDIYKTWTVTFNEALAPETVNEATVFVKNPFNRNVAVTVVLSADGKNVIVTPSQMYVPDLEYELVVRGVVSTANEVLSPSVKIPFVIEVPEAEKKSWSDRQSVSETSSNQAAASTPEKNTNTNTNTNTTVNSPFGSGNSANTTTTNQQSSSPPPALQPEEKKPEHLTSIKVDVNSLVSNVTVKTSNFVATVKINDKQMHYQGNGIYELSVPALKRGQTIKIEAYATYEDNSLLERINHKVK